MSIDSVDLAIEYAKGIDPAEDFDRLTYPFDNNDRDALHKLADEVERLRAENAGLSKKLECKRVRIEAMQTNWDAERLRTEAENTELRKSVATMSCNHKDIGLPGCRICDPRAKPGAGT